MQQNTSPSLPSLDEDYLEFVKDEGLDLLASFRRIRDRRKRDLVVELVRSLADGQPETNGGDV